MVKDKYVETMKFLQEKGLSLSERMTVNSVFYNMLRDEYPFIQIKHKSEDIESYCSTHEAIKSFIFNSEKEVVLANALYLNLGDNFEINEFRNILKFTFRLICSESEWA